MHHIVVWPGPAEKFAWLKRNLKKKKKTSLDNLVKLDTMKLDSKKLYTRWWACQNERQAILLPPHEIGAKSENIDIYMIKMRIPRDETIRR